MNKMQSKNNKKGFTLIEVIVAIGVFVIAMTTATGIFVAALKHQDRALAEQELLSQTSFVIEYMNRGLRMAKKQKPGHPTCITDGLNFETPISSHIKFLKWDYLTGAFVCYEFFLYAGTYRLMRRRAGGVAVPLTSAELKIVNLRFNIIGDAYPEETPPEQPRVTIALEIKGRGRTEQERPQIYLQTTISQRDLDI